MMSTTTDIEKKSLEAHVELCAERYAVLDRSYNTLFNKLESMNGKVERLDSHIMAIREALAISGDKHSKQLIAFGTSIIAVLSTAVISLLINFINK